MVNNINLRELQLYKLTILKNITQICDKYNLTYYLFAGTLLGAVRHNGFIPWDDDLDIAMFWEDYCELLNILKEECPRGYFVQNLYSEKEYPLPYTQIRINGTTSMPVKEAKVNMHWGICIDVFPLIKLFSNRYLYNIQFKAIQIAKSLLLKDYLEKCEYESVGFQKIINKLPNNIRHFFYLIIEKIFVTNPSSNHFLFELSSEPLKKIFKYEDWINVIELKFEDLIFKVPKNYETILRKQYGDYMELPPIEKRGGHELIQGETIIDINNDYSMYKF